MTADGLKDYLSCVKRFPLEKIRDRAHLDQASKQMHSLVYLMTRDALSEGERAYSDALDVLINEWLYRKRANS